MNKLIMTFYFSLLILEDSYIFYTVDEYWDTLHYYAYGYKSINMAEYNFSNIYSFKDFITFTSAENIIMPFYSIDNVCETLIQVKLLNLLVFWRIPWEKKLN